MNTTEVAQLYEDYTDEPNSNFVPSVKTLAYLGRGYREFRRLVREVSPYAYATRVGITITDQNEYDLSSDTSAELVTLLGSAPSVGPIMLNLHRVGWVEGLSDLTQADWFQSTSNRRALRMQTSGFRLYCLEGSTLVFSEDLTCTLVVSYTPDLTTNPFSGIDAYIDDWTDYHDLIALLAWKQYSIRDGEGNDELERQLKAMKASLAMHGKLRQQEQPLYVSDEWESR